MIVEFIGASLDDTCTLQDCVEYCTKQDVLGLDIETGRKFPKNQYVSKVYKPGLDPYLTRMVMLQIGTLERVFVIDTRRVDITSLKEILESEEILKVGHNLKFEYKHILHNTGIRIRNLWDTMLVELILTNGLQMGYGLADLAGRYLDAEKVEKIDLFSLDTFNAKKQDFDEWIYDQEATIYLDKSTRLGFIEIGDRPFTTKQKQYGADDVILPLRIREKQLGGAFNYTTKKWNYYKQLAKGWWPAEAIELENQFVQVLGEIEYKGMHFDSEVWLNTYNEELPIFHQRKKKLDDYIVQNYPKFTGPGDLFSGEGSCAIKWSSSKQVISFFRHLEICPKERSKQTKRQEWTVGATSVYKQLTNEHKGFYQKGKDVEIVDEKTFQLQYLLFKKSEQSITTFGKDWLKYVHPLTKRVHSNYRQILNTGRISSTAPNLQNIPGHAKYRSAFTAPKGYKVINTDYSAQEVRVLASISQVQAMLDFFKQKGGLWGDDFHSYTATRVQRILKKNPNYMVPMKDLVNGDPNPEFSSQHKKERTDAKSVTFKLSYGGTPYSLKDELGISIEEAEFFFKVYFEAFPGLEDNFKQRKKAALRNRYIEIDPITQRRWFCPFSQEMDELEEQCWSYYPDNYKDLDPISRQSVKDRLKSDHPELSGMWGDFMRMKGKLERNSLNYPVQGCLPADTNVLTKGGWVPIGEFVDGTEVWTGNNWASATRVYRGEAERVDVYLNDGRSISFDDRHKLLIKPKDKAFYEWCPIKEVAGKELVRPHDPSLQFGKQDLTEEDWYWAGRIMGDGYIRKNGYWGCVFRTDGSQYDESEAIPRFEKWLAKWKFSGSTNFSKGWSGHFNYNTRKLPTSYGVKLAAKDTYRVWKQFGFEAGRGTKEKIVPHKVFTQDHTRRAAFLKGWYDADGRKYRKNSRKSYPQLGGVDLIRLTTASIQAAKGAVQLAESLGIRAKFVRYNTWYDVSFFETKEPLMVDAIEFTNKVEPMFTLAVDDYRHSFSSEGVISKNTSGSMLKRAAVKIYQRLRNANFLDKVWLNNLIHDESNAIALEEFSNQGASMIKTEMEAAGGYFCPGMPMTATPVITEYWNH